MDRLWENLQGKINNFVVMLLGGITSSKIAAIFAARNNCLSDLMEKLFHLSYL